MSEIFHKSCYTSRSSGYKYRTLATNTGDKKHRDAHQDSNLDTKLKDLKREMSSRIDSEVDCIAKSRESILERFHKVDTKINSMLELQNTIVGLRKNLHQAESTLASVIDQVDKIETTAGEAYSLQSKKPSFRSPPIEEEKELSSTITRI